MTDTSASYGPGDLHLHFHHRTITVPVERLAWTRTGDFDTMTLEWDEDPGVAFDFDGDQLMCWTYVPRSTPTDPTGV